MTRVFLVNSPSHEPGKVLNKAGGWIPGEQLGLCYLAAVLRDAGHHVELCDAFMLGLTSEEVATTIVNRAANFDVIGLSVSDGKVHGCVGVLERLCSLPDSTHLTLGGHTATLCAAEFLTMFPRLDSVIRGEGELPLLSLCNDLKNGEDWHSAPGLSYRTPSGQPRHNKLPRLTSCLDHLPFPARDNLPLCLANGFVVSVETSRGCKGICAFCATRMMYRPSAGRSWRARSIDNILQEVETLVTNYGVHRIAFEDEDFLGFGSGEGFDRARAFANEIIARGLKFEFAFLTRVDNIERDLLHLLKQAGLRFVFVGVESGAQKSLDFFVKETTVPQNVEALRILEELEIDHEILWIMYDPSTTLDAIKSNIGFLQHVRKLNINLLNKLRVYHGTPMHAQLSRKGRLRGTFLEYEYTFEDPKVSIFEQEATRGLNAYYQVLRRLDRIKWDLGYDSPLNAALDLVAQRLHLGATAWLNDLYTAVRTSSDLVYFEERAVISATESAVLLSRLSQSWPSQSQ